MKLKRWMMVILLTLGLVACGNQPVQTGGDKNDIVRDAFFGISRSEDILQIYVEEYDKELSFEGEGHFADVFYTVPGLADEDSQKYPELAKAIESQFADTENRIKDNITNMVDIHKNMGSKDIYYFDKVSTMVTRADKTCVSFLRDWSSYTGGAHANYAKVGYNFDTDEGRLLEFSDVITDEDAFFEMVDKKLQDRYGDDGYDGIEVLAEYRQSVKDNNLSYSFTVDYDGVCIYFNPYDIGPYASGAFATKICFDEGDFFAEKYTKVPKAYIYPIKEDVAEYIDLDKDGNKDKVEAVKLDVIGAYGDDAYNYSLRVNDEDIPVLGTFYQIKTYVAKDEDRTGIFVVTEDEYRLSTLLFFDMENKTFLGEGIDADGAFVDSFYTEELIEANYNSATTYYKKATFTDCAYLNMDVWMYALGYYRARGVYGLDLEKQEVFFKGHGLKPTVPIILQARRDVNCEILDGSGNITGTGVIPSDMYLMIESTDGETFANLIQIDKGIVETMSIGTDDYKYLYTMEANPSPKEPGVIYRVTFENGNDYSKKIDGTSEEEAFYGVLYAG